MITDRQHADQVRLAGHAAWEKLINLWLTEHADASAPASGPAVTVGGGNPSDPVSTIATDPTRERHANAVAQRITGILDRMQADLEALTPTRADRLPPCTNCGEMPATRAGRCPECAPHFLRHGFDRDPEEVADKWQSQIDARPCRSCGTPLKIAEGKRTCDACRQRKHRSKTA